MTPAVFISHASADRKVARHICSALELRGVACWLASRDVLPGQNFGDVIPQVIRACKVMVLVFSESANNSSEIKKEVVLAGKSGCPVIPLRVEDVEPRGAFEYELATRQWIDAFADWDEAMAGVLAQITGIVGPGTLAAAVPERSRSPDQAEPALPLPATAPPDAAPVAEVAGPAPMDAPPVTATGDASVPVQPRGVDTVAAARSRDAAPPDPWGPDTLVVAPPPGSAAEREAPARKISVVVRTVFRSARRRQAVALVAAALAVGWIVHAALQSDHATPDPVPPAPAIDTAVKPADAPSVDDLNRRGLQADDGGDPATAMQLYTQAADRGSAAAMRHIGWLYHQGHGMPVDFGQAMTWYLKAADGGDGDAMSNIGLMYQYGQSVPQDYQQAVDWFIKGAAVGSASAERNLGDLYSDGTGVGKDSAKAFGWYQKAASAGDADAQYKLGRDYWLGRGTKRDMAQARSWIAKAAQGGSGDAKSWLDQH